MRTLRRWFVGAAGPTPAALVGLGALGIVLATLGQAVTTRTVPSALSWLVFFDGRLRSTYGVAAESVAAAVILLAVGALLFALASRKSASDEETPPFEPLAKGWHPTSRGDYIVVAMFGFGVALFTAIIIRLLDGHYSHGLALLFLLSVLLLATPFLRRDRQQRVRFQPRLSPVMAAEAGFLAVVIAGFVFLNVHDLTNWRFSAIGDEYIWYYEAKAIADGADFNPFSQAGPRQAFPVGTSALHAVTLKIFGGDIFAWKVHLVAVAAASFVPLYLLVRDLFSRRAAIFAIVILASSHYLFAYVHHPPYIIELLPSVTALWLLTLGLRRNSTLALFGSGVAAGFGFYVWPAARIAIVIMAIYMLTFGRKSIRLATVLPIAVSFVAMVGPLFAVERWNAVASMPGGTALGYGSASVVGDRLDRIGFNIVRSIMAFNFNPNPFHYVSGSLLDPVSAVLFVLGIGLALSKIRHPAFRLLVVWWVVALAAAGFTNPYGRTAITRLHFVLPVAAALGGLAVDQALHLLHNLRPNVAIRTVLAAAALGVLIPLLLFLNLQRFWSETPQSGPTTVATVAVRAVFSSMCQDRLPDVTVVARQPGALLAGVLGSYQLGEKTPTLLPYQDGIDLSALIPNPFDSQRPRPRPPPLVPYKDALAVFRSEALARGHIPDGCIIVTRENDPLAETALARLRSRYPDKQQIVLTDHTGSREVTVLY